MINTQAPPRPLHDISRIIAWPLSLLCCLGALLAPAIWNGFPLVFFDTGGYIAAAMELKLVPGRSLFYGAFLWLTTLGWQFFWGPVVIQALATLWMIHQVLRHHSLPSGPLATASFCTVLGTLTGISWYTGQLMPDGMVPLTVLALYLTGFHWRKLNRLERFLVTVCTLLGMLSHMSCLALALGLVAVLCAARLLGRGQGIAVCILPPALMVAATLLCMPLVHLGVSGTFGYTPGGPAFLFGRLVQDGIAQRWLAEHCPARGITLCTLQDRIPATADEFLWSDTSPFRDIGGWNEPATAQLSRLVGAILQDYPAQFGWTSLRATGEQLLKVATGDGLDEYQPVTQGFFVHLLPHAAPLFTAAHQQQGQITQRVFDRLNRIHVPVALLSLLGMLPVLAWALKTRRIDLALLASFVLASLLGNAFICGALSNPHDRYQSRLIWLATLVVGVALAGCWQKPNTLPCGNRADQPCL